MAFRNKSHEREAQRIRRQTRARKKLRGSSERPRLVVHRSSKHIQGHITDDATNRTLLGISTLAADFKDLRGAEGGTKTALSKAAGKLLAERAQAAGIKKVVFDRGGNLYHGRVAAFAEGAREGGLEF
jgi:large subunit ribosomal protein L18